MSAGTGMVMAMVTTVPVPVRAPVRAPTMAPIMDGTTITARTTITITVPTTTEIRRGGPRHGAVRRRHSFEDAWQGTAAARAAMPAAEPAPLWRHTGIPGAGSGDGAGRSRFAEIS